MPAYSCQPPSEAKIKILSGQDISAAPTLPCTVEAYGEGRLVLRVAEPIAINRSVNVEYDDALFLGDVISCYQENSVYIVTVLVEQILHGLNDLIALRASLLMEEPEWRKEPLPRAKAGNSV